MVKIAISQPTFLPWPGYFALLDYCDFFVFLDDVQFQRRSWQQRNFIKNNLGKKILTLPIKKKGLQSQKILDTQIIIDSKDYKNILKTVIHSYSKSKYFSTFKDDLFYIFNSSDSNLSSLNVKLIFFFCKILNIKTNFFYSSKLKVSGKKDELIFNIINSFQFINCEYYYTEGSSAYINNSFFFKTSNIKLKKFKFNYPNYNQLYGKFIPNLSIIDILFNEGPDCINKIRNSFQISND